MINSNIWIKDLILLLTGQTISMFGNAVLQFVLPLYILEQSGSPALFGQITALSFLPAIILSPIGGIIADKINKQRIMLVLDFSTSMLILMYIFLYDYISSASAVVVVLMALYAIQGAYTPTVQSSIPLLVTPDKLIPTNAAINLLSSLSSMIGPIVGGFLYGSFGLASVLSISCVCFFMSAVIKLFINIAHIGKKCSGSIWLIVRNDMRDSFRYITKEMPLIGQIVAVLFSFNIMCVSMFLVGLPVLIMQNLALTGEHLGITQGVIMTGGFAGGLLTGILGKRMVVQNTHRLLLFCGLLILPMGLTLLIGNSAIASYIVISIGSFFAMLLFVIWQIQIMAFLQAVTPAEISGKVLSYVISMSVCSQAIGQMLYGQLFESFNTVPWAIMFGSAGFSCGIGFYSKRCVRMIEQRRSNTNRKFGC